MNIVSTFNFTQNAIVELHIIKWYFKNAIVPNDLSDTKTIELV